MKSVDFGLTGKKKKTKDKKIEKKKMYTKKLKNKFKEKNQSGKKFLIEYMYSFNI